MIEACEVCGSAPDDEQVKNGRPFMVHLSLAIYRFTKSPFGEGLVMQPAYERRRLCLGCAAPLASFFESSGDIARELSAHAGCCGACESCRAGRHAECSLRQCQSCGEVHGSGPCRQW